MKRKQVKALLGSLEAAHPGIKKSLLTSLTRVNTAHLLDRRWHAAASEVPAAAAGRPAASIAIRPESA